MPKFRVWWPDIGEEQEDSLLVDAHDHEEAAAEWAHWYDQHSAEYSIVGGSPATVMVEMRDDAAPLSVTVYGEMERSYRGKLGGGHGD